MDEIVQADYVRITLAMLEAFGIAVEVSPGFGPCSACSPPLTSRPIMWWRPMPPPPVISWALAAVTGGQVTLTNLPRETHQPDIRFLDVLEPHGGAGSNVGRGEPPLQGHSG